MDPSLWTCIDIRKEGELDELPYNLFLTCHHTIKSSRGGCVDISIDYIGDDCLLEYIVNSCYQLRRLRLIFCMEVSNEGLSIAATKLPLLATFENYYGSFCHCEYMHGLHHLSLLGNKLMNKGLRAILDGSSHLESLDLSQCYNVNLKDGGDLKKKCKRIKDLKRLWDSTADHEFSAYNDQFLYEVYSSFDSDYYSDYSDYCN